MIRILLVLQILTTSCITLPYVRTNTPDCQTEFPQVAMDVAAVNNCVVGSDIYYHRGDLNAPYSEVRYLDCVRGVTMAVWAVSGRDHRLMDAMPDGRIVSWCQMYTDDGDDLGIYWIIQRGS